MRIPDPFGFPNPVNEKAARTVAAGVVLQVVLALATGWWWLTVPLAAGFALRVLAGPRFSPLGQLATRVISPQLGLARLIPGPPKRFAQTIGAVLSLTAVIGWAAHSTVVVVTALVGIGIAATLESVFALCLGCTAFGWLMQRGIIPPETCEACSNVGLRLRTP